MKISMDWLRDWVEIDEDGAAIAAELTVAGLEVDAIASTGPGLEGVKIAHVRSVQPHPNADRLSLCTVFDGREELTIVCGAPNVAEGLNVPLAPVGTSLPNGLKIKTARIRGIESNGMLCSARELDLVEDVDGLLILGSEAQPGTPLTSYLHLPDEIIDVDLTPNRGDCFSILGIAREVAARRSGVLLDPAAGPVDPITNAVHAAQLDSPADCPRFVTRVIGGLRPDACTPDWMKERLRRVGLRPISPVVDVTNYVMWELGQPLHAYDSKRLTGDLRARRARSGEQLVLLDGTSIELDDDVLVIADDSGAIGLAGIMGGASTSIDTATSEIVLEAAFFSQRIIQGRARRYGMHTDASVRFERGIDPTGQVRAIERATSLLIAIAGGEPGPVTIAEQRESLPTISAVILRHARVEAVLGSEIPAASISMWLERLGMEVAEAAGGWSVTPPAHRFDIAIEEDLIEEVGRMMGYDTIDALPGTAAIRLGEAPERRVSIDEIADTLVARGFDEIISYTFIDPALQLRSIAPAANEGEPSLANPLSQELSSMRASLWPGLIRVAQQNLSRQRNRCRLFETGTVFSGDSDSVWEGTAVAGIAIGTLEPEHWDGASRDVDYFDLKADVAALIATTGNSASLSFRACEHPALNPASATAIMLDEICIGYLGALHPHFERVFDIRKGAILFELDVEKAFNAKVGAYRPFSRFPHVRRDIAVVVDEATNAGELTKLVAETLGDKLQRTIVFDEYRGKALETGRKSIGLGLILQDAYRTLTDADADQLLADAIRRLEHELGAKIRT